MKKITLSLFLISILIFYSCGTSTRTTHVNLHAQAHNQMHQDFMNEELQKEIVKIVNNISGIYIGNLPCSDCEKIIYQLQLNEDLSYHTKVIYQGKSDVVIETSGTFSINNNLMIQLDQNAGSMNYFIQSGNGLLMMDKDGKEITGDLADKYILLPKIKDNNEPTQNRKQQIMHKKWNDGVDFYAFGNEPFWSLDMDFNEDIRFKNLDGIDFNAPAVEPISAMDAAVKRYRSVTESGDIIVQLIHSECMDNMSGEKFKYGVTIDYKLSTETGYKTFKGCGRFIPDPRLHGIWTIIEVDGMTLKQDDFKNEFPRLEINASKEVILGHDGCNSFTGGIEILNKAIIFGKLAGTMMACPDLEISNKIGMVLSGKKLSYIINDKLEFYNGEKKVMILKHID